MPGKVGSALTTLVVTGLLAALPGVAQAEVLFDHFATSSAGSYLSMDFEPVLDSSDSLGADDFQVPPGEVWLVQRAFVEGVAEGPGTLDLVNTSLFATDGTLPADEPIHSEQLTADPGTPLSDFSLDLGDPVVLPAGTWWLGVQAKRESNMQPTWYWQSNVELSGNPAAWRNPGNGEGKDCIVFADRSECFGAGAPDNSFTVEGLRASGEFAVTASKAKRKGKLSLTVNAPNLGTLEVSSKQMKPATVEVTELGEVPLKLKPTRRAKHKLTDGKRPKAKLTLDLPPYVDGTALEAGFKKKLKL